jgi:hypothetical protein
MLTALLISALVVLLVVLGRENDQPGSRKVVEIVDYSETELSDSRKVRSQRLNHRPVR